MKTIKDIVFVRADIKGRTPAKCDHNTWVIYININEFYKYTHPQRTFILLHEIGHLKQHTHSEITADEWAYNQFINHGYTLAEADSVLAATLPGTNAEQLKRIKTQHLRVLKTKTMKANNHYYDTLPHIATPQARSCNDCGNCTNCKRSYNRASFYDGDDSYDGEDNFLGLGKKAQERKRLRNESKNKARELKAQATLELAKQGVSEHANKRQNNRNMLGGILGAATSLVGSFTGGGAATGKAGEAITNALMIKDEAGNDVPNPNYNPELPVGKMPDPALAKPWYKQTGAIIGMAVGGVAVIGLIIFLAKKK